MSEGGGERGWGGIWGKGLGLGWGSGGGCGGSPRTALYLGEVCVCVCVCVWVTEDGAVDHYGPGGPAVGAGLAGAVGEVEAGRQLEVQLRPPSA